MIRADTGRTAEGLRNAAQPIVGMDADYDPLLDRIGDASIVLLGEATHGTHEFYHARSQITQRLIAEKGFDAVAVEADWPDAYRVNRYVQGQGEDEQAIEALGDFQRFPTWMWRNADVLDLVGWLRDHNDEQPMDRRVGFYGLDLYSLHSSIEAVLRYLDDVDPPAAERARARYSCFDHTMLDPQRYGYASAIGARPDCEQEAVQQLLDLQRRAEEYLRRDGILAVDEQFYAEQNARLVVRAENYYRSMFGSRVSSWNLRDKHMADTLSALSTHLHGSRGSGKVVVWAHNSHIGDARATEMSRQRELNLGQLARQYHGAEAVIVGFTTYHGSVSAASNWGDPVERKRVRPALPDSCEDLFHNVKLDAFMLQTDHPVVGDVLSEPRLQRMIGVIYRPETERQSHYFQCQLADQMDVVIHFDHSRAVEPLERSELWQRGETPETYPTGL
ncbi:MAG: erythromycin esterase family protein [Phycisphaeraceae bacterium]